MSYEHPNVSAFFNYKRVQSFNLFICRHYDALRNTEKWGHLNAEQLEFIEKAVKDYKASKVTFEFENEDCFW